MTHPNGYNPMRWDCEDRGCWKVKCSPNIEYFAGALPRKIAMTDLDGTVEVNGHFLFLEWKSHGADIPVGQRIYFERLTKLSDKIVAVVVAGDPDTMQVDKIKSIYKGRISEWEECSLLDLFDRIKRWSTKVDIQVVAQGRAA